MNLFVNENKSKEMHRSPFYWHIAYSYCQDYSSIKYSTSIKIKLSNYFLQLNATIIILVLIKNTISAAFQNHVSICLNWLNLLEPLILPLSVEKVLGDQYLHCCGMEPLPCDVATRPASHCWWPWSWTTVSAVGINHSEPCIHLLHLLCFTFVLCSWHSFCELYQSTLTRHISSTWHQINILVNLVCVSWTFLFGGLL